ncbi:3-hydroxymyristoyl/3-hydroxydecanoyl-(acyl carrier protein) dehydratase [Elusimicrobium posterum]|uniref:ApeI family dehydratase n=1 Tax=Elusimicrobium posterum TaxID=3116653 RepID=UPI003C72DF2E
MNTVINAIEKIYKQTANGAEFLLPADFPAFNGHFPGQPVLPGIVQVEMAVYTIGKIKGAAAALKEVKKAKFANPALPGDLLKLAVTPKENNEYDILITNGEDKLCARLQLRAE